MSRIFQITPQGDADLENADLISAGLIGAGEIPSSPFTASRLPPSEVAAAVPAPLLWRDGLATVPRAVYRLRFHKGFPLEAAVPLADYLADLGVSHVCASPLLRSRPGRRHGTNVVDFSAIDPDLGGARSLERLSAALHRAQIGLLMELAPGHMGVGGTDNEAWLDLLEWGRDSAYAAWFDVDWRAGDIDLRNKVLVPFLDRPYWEAIGEGALTLSYDSGLAGFAARHNEHAFPICPADWASILEAADTPALSGMADLFRTLSAIRPDREELRAAKYRLLGQAETEEGARAMRGALAAYDGRTPDGRARLNGLLDRQNFRLAWWRAANDDLNFRRFVETPGLIGLRLERTDVFEAVHAYAFQLYAEGLLDGFRVAHLDLMADPAAYARRLALKLSDLSGRRPQEALPAAGCIGLPPGLFEDRRTARADLEAPAVAPGEDAMAEAVSLVMHDPLAAPALADVSAGLGDERRSFEEARALSRRTLLAETFGAELQATARALHDVARGAPEGRDATFAALKRIARALAVAFPARRAFGDMDGRSAHDAALYAAAFARARADVPPIDLPVMDLVERWLGGEAPRAVADFAQSGARAHAIARFQQLTASLDRAVAEGMLGERYGRLLSRNERGSDPALVGLRAAAFHQMAGALGQAWPAAPIVTAGPEHKRGEDARMRLAVISELPGEWETLVRQLMEQAGALRGRTAAGPCPLPADEALLYQSLVGAWPLTLRLDDTAGLADLKARVRRWFLEAVRRTRRGTRPLFGNEDYEAGCARFVDGLFELPEAAPVRRLIAAFVERISLASVINGYGQAVLKCTLPGMPDIHQGTEFWDFALDEPDNLRAVDFPARASALASGLPAEALLGTWPDGRAKQTLIARLLRLRAAEPALFAKGSYEPLHVEGMREASGLAFLRRHEGKAVIVAVTRLAAHLVGPDPMPPRVPTVRWGDTGFALPDGLAGEFRDAITGRRTEASMGRLEFGDLFAAFPAAVLTQLA
ncbi:malto-oligosyltrehalose synthase [Xanthobacter sp. KR7-225]|uniref:malto-oligosyltrehalose synthase n=1 Tax=Xanthobacter sp. KR7-225 TaxID=3156613 RepID=UPI0032B5AE0B